MNVLFAGLVEGAIIGGVVGVVGAVCVVLFGPKKKCPECQKQMPTPMFKALKNCPHCGAELPQSGKKK